MGILAVDRDSCDILFPFQEKQKWETLNEIISYQESHLEK